MVRNSTPPRTRWQGNTKFFLFPNTSLFSPTSTVWFQSETEHLQQRLEFLYAKLHFHSPNPTLPTPDWQGLLYKGKSAWEPAQQSFTQKTNTGSYIYQLYWLEKFPKHQLPVEMGPEIIPFFFNSLFLFLIVLIFKFFYLFFILYILLYIFCHLFSFPLSLLFSFSFSLIIFYSFVCSLFSSYF